MLKLLALSFLLTAPQDDFEARVSDLSDRLASDGIEDKLAGLIRTDPGMILLKEQIERVVEAHVTRVEEGWFANFEKDAFERTEKGELRLKAGQQEFFDSLRDRRKEYGRLREEVRAAIEELVEEISEEDEADRVIRERLLSPEVQLTVFSQMAWAIRESRPENILGEFLTQNFIRGTDGRLRIRGGIYMDEVQGIMEEGLEMSRELRSVGRRLRHFAALVKGEEAKLLVTDAAGRIIVMRAVDVIWEEFNGGDEDDEPEEDEDMEDFGDDQEEEEVDYLELFIDRHFDGSPDEGYVANDKARALFENAAKLRKSMVWIKGKLASISEDMIDEGIHGKMKRFLKSERAQIIAAIHVEEVSSEARGQIQGSFNEVRDLAFDRSAAGLLTFRFKGLMSEDGPEEDPDGDNEGLEVAAEFVEILFGRAGEASRQRRLLLSLADEAEDEKIAELLAAPELQAEIFGQFERLFEDKIARLHATGFDVFLKAFFREDDSGALRVRLHRIPDVEAMLAKASELDSQADRAGEGR